MSLLKDFWSLNMRVRKRYWLREFFNPANWARQIKWRHQRAERGWSDKDTWGGGEYIAEVSAGILNSLQSDKGHVDWEEYFRWNYPENFGYTSLNEVAQDINNYLVWEEESFSSPIYGEYKDDYETRWAIEYQLYESYREAMHFVAENIGQLWD